MYNYGIRHLNERRYVPVKNKLLAIFLVLALLLPCAQALADGPIDPTGEWVLRALLINDEWFWNGLDATINMTISGDGTAVLTGQAPSVNLAGTYTWKIDDRLLSLKSTESGAYGYGEIQGTVMRFMATGIPDMLFEHLLPMPADFSPVGYWTSVEIRDQSHAAKTAEKGVEYQLTLGEDGTGTLAYVKSSGKKQYEKPITWAMTENGLQVTFSSGSSINFRYENGAIVAEQESSELVFEFHPEIADDVLVGTWNGKRFKDSLGGMDMDLAEVGLRFVTVFNADGTGAYYIGSDDDLILDSRFTWEKEEEKITAHTESGTDLHFIYEKDWLYKTDEPLWPCMQKEDVKGLPKK